MNVKPHSLQHRRRALRGDLDRQAGGFEHVGAAARARRRAVAVLGDRNAGRRDDERGHRRDVDRVRVIAARPDHVDDHRQPVLDVQAALAHRARRADDLVDALAFRCERDEQRAACAGVYSPSMISPTNAAASSCERSSPASARRNSGLIVSLDEPQESNMGRHREEVLDDAFAVFAQHRFGMELHAVDRTARGARCLARRRLRCAR